MNETNNITLAGDDSEVQDGRYLEAHGRTLINNGYAIIPIKAGSKSPGFQGWEKTKATPNLVREWLSSGHADSGVGILTRDTPAIDLDILDQEVADRIEEWCWDNIGAAPVRYGRSCKRLLMYRTEEPFRKMKTGKYEDEWGEEHEIEILADGQQFVAYAIHKDTGLPYRWSTSDHPINMHAENLNPITQDQCKALMNYFAELAKELGWTKKTKGLSGDARPIDAGDDVFADVESIVDIADSELRERLLLVVGSDDYDRWVQVGMALFHQFGGDTKGLEMWHEWSETADNYDAEALDKHWRSFNIDGKGRAPVTARTILTLAKEAVTTAIIQETVRLKDKFLTAQDLQAWRDTCTDVKHSEIDTLARVQITEIAKKRYKELTGASIPMAELRKQLAYEMKSAPNTPDWCKNWVYDSSCDKFFHTTWKTAVTNQGFNALFGRYALTKQDLLEGRAMPSKTPTELSLNVFKIPHVYGQRYAPGKEIIFKDGMIAVANTYIPCSIELPEELTPADKLAIARVKKHIAHLLPDSEKQRLFTDWLAWIVQNPGKLLKWAMVLQGVQGDGKSFFGVLLRSVMGHTNVRMMNATILESNFTGWAVGQCVAVIEEPRLHGQNRYDVMNKIKPYITNPIIEVHPKGQNSYDTENTTNYFMPTNHRDAFPLSMNERRYLVMFSQWQQREALLQFVNDNPDYYHNLYMAVENRSPALRKWLLEHEVSQDFPAEQPAPITDDFKYMVSSSSPEGLQALDEVIKEGHYPDVTEHLLNITRLQDAMLGLDIELPKSYVLNKLLENAGYSYIGRHRIENERYRFWSKSPHLFMEGSEYSALKIRKYIKERQDEIDNEL